MPPPALPPERPTAAFVRKKTICPLFSATEIQTASVPVCIPPIASRPHRHAGRHLQGFRNGASQHGNHPHQNRRFRQRRQLGTDYGAMGYSNIPFNPEHVRMISYRKSAKSRYAGTAWAWTLMKNTPRKFWEKMKL